MLECSKSWYKPEILTLGWQIGFSNFIGGCKSLLASMQYLRLTSMNIALTKRGFLDVWNLWDNARDGRSGEYPAVGDGFLDLVGILGIPTWVIPPVLRDSEQVDACMTRFDRSSARFALGIRELLARKSLCSIFMTIGIISF
jgi:hypothetical protein